MSRKVNRIIWHCSANKPMDCPTVYEIRAYHLSKGWSDIGYHYYIEADGTISKGRPEWRHGSHVQGYNDDSIGICYCGGLDENGNPADTRSPSQRLSLYELTDDLLGRYRGATLHGHNEFSSKACPGFDVQKDWAEYKGNKE